MGEHFYSLPLNLIFLTFLPAAFSNNDTNTTPGADNTTSAHLTAIYGSTVTPNPNMVPQVVLTIVTISGCGLLGLGIAKLGDYCYDRRMATRDDISNASEYTKNILRTSWRRMPVNVFINRWMVVMKMKPDPPDEDDRSAKRAASAWMENTVNGKHTNKSETDDKQKDKSDTDVEKGVSEPTPSVMEDDVFSVAAPATPTINVIPSTTTDTPALNTPSGPSPAVSPLPHNKVAPASPMPASNSEIKKTPTMPSSNKEIKGLPPGGRGNALPPISPRPEDNSINQPIRSTR